MEKKFKNIKLKKRPKIVVITGAESTGKSTLTEQLALHFNTLFMPEIARLYVEGLNRKYTYNDVEQIAKLQVENLNTLCKQPVPFVFVDTWLIITKVWFEFVYKKTPGWLVDEIRKMRIDLFLVCDTDLPWIYDPVRENGGENRNILQNLYIKNITEFGFKYRIVQGTNSERLANAINFVEELNKT
jgi:NadR type nicotinamide-nucleotide adenylyltransferase